MCSSDLWEGGSTGARVNRAEAEASVEEIGRLLDANPARSIGVVTFNTQQRDLILDLLETSTDPAIEAALGRDEEPLFVKNLENVQGDERDVIIFTLAFAKDARGRVPLNWGPLTRAGGERRLNVAVTRAKERVIVLGSFEPEEFDLAGSTSQGLADLRDYIFLAKHGPDRAGLTRARGRDLHLEDVATALRDAGLEVRSHVGLSEFTVDLAVRVSRDVPWVAVLLDGPLWARRTTVNDREGLPRTVLEKSMGWSRVLRLWLPTWLRERNAVVEAIVAEARGIRSPDTHVARDRGSAQGDAPIGRPHERSATTPEQHPELDDGHDQVAALLRRHAEARAGSEPGAARSAPSAEITPAPGAQKFVAAGANHKGDVRVLDNLGVSANRARVQVDIDEILAAEAPVLVERLARIVAYRYGLNRLRESRRESIAALVPRVRVRKAPNGDLVAWHAGQEPGTWRSYRVPGDSREILDIPYEEIRNAMVDITRRSHGIGEEDLLRQAANAFGVGRLASKVRPRLEKVLVAAIREGALVRRNLLVEIPQ